MISQACESFDVSTADPCGNTCPKLILRYHDACRASADAEIQAVFSSLGPLVSMCQGASGASGSESGGKLRGDQEKLAPAADYMYT
jgi:hypothetical protein